MSTPKQVTLRRIAVEWTDARATQRENEGRPRRREKETTANQGAWSAPEHHISMKQYPVEEQVGNLLNVLKLHAGQYVLGKTKSGKPGQACSSLNPLMSDGGIQPPGEPLYGPRLYNSREDCQAHVDRLCAKHPGNPDGYCVVSAEEWVMQTRIHGADKTLREVLAERPELKGSKPEADKNMPEHWVVRLEADEPVDVALDRRGDGTSDDCFVTTARELVAAGFGQMSFERTASGVTVFVDTREQFVRIMEACEI
jgi:hypothetical protein